VLKPERSEALSIWRSSGVQNVTFGGCWGSLDAVFMIPYTMQSSNWYSTSALCTRGVLYNTCVVSDAGLRA
jgi:hypothetical protein